MKNQTTTLKMLVRTVGWAKTVKILMYKLLGSKSVSVRVADTQVLLRMNNCDLPLLHDVFCTDECEVGLSWTPKTILDLGGNIGLTALKLRKQFPSARLIAVEPDTETYEVCVKNLEHLQKCVVLNLAVGVDSKKVICINPEAESISRKFAVSELGLYAAIDSMSIRTILKHYECESPILIKMDIEGAEEGCFESAAEWLETVQGILVEPHGIAIDNLITETLKNHGFLISRLGEKILGERTSSAKVFS